MLVDLTVALRPIVILACAQSQPLQQTLDGNISPISEPNNDLKGKNPQCGLVAAKTMVDSTGLDASQSRFSGPAAPSKSCALNSLSCKPSPVFPAKQMKLPSAGRRYPLTLHSENVRLALDLLP